MDIDPNVARTDTRQGNSERSSVFPSVFPARLVLWWLMALAWFGAISWLPDPRPLAVPEWVLQWIASVLRLSEAPARMVATIALRGIGFGLLGFLVSLGVCATQLRWQTGLAILLAPGMAIASQWINYGHVPIIFQMQLSVLSSAAGVLIGLGLRSNRIATVLLIVGLVGIVLWSKPMRITPNLEAYARATALHVMAYANRISDRDEGFVESMRIAIAFAEDNSHGTDPVIPNQAAILALGIVLGEARVAQVAGRNIVSLSGEQESLRNRITLRERHDLSRHFWVSAALAVLMGERRALLIGTAKELMDSTPGGSGFSFVDQLANKAGVRFASSTTASPQSALEMQIRILAGLSPEDFLPEIEGLPEQIRGDEFHSEFGGVGGERTRHLDSEIERRIGTRAGLNVDPVRGN